MASDQHRRDWEVLSARANSLLESAAIDPRPAALLRQFRALIRPSFEDAFAVALWRSPDGQAAYATKVVWRQSADLPKFENPIAWLKHRGAAVPTFEAARKRLAPGVAARVAASFAGLNVPLARTSQCGLDGTAYRFDYGDVWASTSHAWWESGPPAWAPLVAAFHAFLLTVEGDGTWEECPIASGGQVLVTAEWKGSAPTAGELGALRSIVPDLAQEPLGELRARAAVPRFRLGILGWVAADELQKRGAEVGVRIVAQHLAGESGQLE